MNRFRVAIIEDEVPAARLLRSLVAGLRPEWEIEVLPGSVEEAAAWFAANDHPDLLFLDIRLSDGTSFDLLSKVRPASAVIFTTAYDEYAIRAFSVNSIDYLLKPVDKERLADAIVKYETLTRIRRPDDYLSMLLDALQGREKKFRTRFLIAGVDRFRTLQVDGRGLFLFRKQGDDGRCPEWIAARARPSVEPPRRTARPRPLFPGEPARCCSRSAPSTASSLISTERYR